MSRHAKKMSFRLRVFIVWFGVLAVFGRTAFPETFAASIQPQPSVPQLNGRHFEITIVPDLKGFVDLVEHENGTLTYSGFLLDTLRALAREERANFTYSFRTPSGYGSLCMEEPEEPYPRDVWGHYACAQSDVTDLPHTQYTTDMYLGAFYITPERQLLNHFTIPLFPPTTGTQAMVGTATNIRDFDDFVRQQKVGKQGPACVLGNTAYSSFVRQIFPTIELVDIFGGDDAWHQAFVDKTCDVIIIGYPFATNFVLSMSRSDRCQANGKPIGIIGDPLGFGLNYFGIGIRKDLPSEVVDTLNYWLNTLMTCSPNEECPDTSLAVLFPKNGGTGRECGYVQFPPPDGNLSPRLVAGIVVGCVAFVGAISSCFYLYKLKQQEKRFKKRFVQQIARNINIGPSPSCIPVEKLAEEVQHIGNKEGTITKAELLQWMLDVKLEFISDRDFNALWAAMDIDNKGEVNAIDFFVFLSACGSEFEEVYQEQQTLPKQERLKLAARRLSNINKLGESGVRRLQMKLERSNGSTPKGIIGRFSSSSIASRPEESAIIDQGSSDLGRYTSATGSTRTSFPSFVSGKSCDVPSRDSTTTIEA